MYAHGLPGVRAIVSALGWGIVVVGGVGLSGCSSSPIKAEPTKAEVPGVLRAAGVVHVSTANDFRQWKTLHDEYAKAGVAESDMVDGASVVARALCCGADMDNSQPVVLYNQQHLKIEPGDFVEFRIGGLYSDTHKNDLNVITRVLQHGEPSDGQCWWEPRNPKLWRRLVYCEWMQKEGWVRDDSWGDPGWYKPPAAQTP